MRFSLAIIAGLFLAVATVAAASYPGYCGQQWPRLFAASLCGHLSEIGGSVVGRSNGAMVRASARAMQTGGLASPTWTELSTEEPGSWQHTDGYTYTVIEGVQNEVECNNWFTFEDYPSGRCISTTCTRETSANGPGGKVYRLNFTGSGGTFFQIGPLGEMVAGDWGTQCIVGWVESGTLDVRLSIRYGNVVIEQTHKTVTLTTTPTWHCVRAQLVNTSNTAFYVRVIEDPVGDGTGKDFLISYMSGVKGSIAGTPIKHNAATFSCAATVQREADVLPFATDDLSVETGEGQVDVAWLDYAYDWPATPAVHTIVSLAKPGEVRDDTGGTLYTGTIQSAPVFDDGGLDMDGVDDFVDTPDVAALDTGTGDFSAEAWFRVDNDKTWNVVMAKRTNVGTDPGWSVERSSASLIRFSTYSSAAGEITVGTASGPYTDGNWHHVMVVRDRTGDGKLHLYLDGAEPETAVADGGAGNNLNNAQSFRAGRVNTASTFFEGAIKKVIYYVGTAKSLADATAAYNAGHPSGFSVPADATLAWSMVPTDCHVYYDRPDVSTNRFAYTCGGPTVWQTTTFERGAVSEFTWRRKAGTPLELCVDGVCVNSAQNYVAPFTLDANGCWGCDDPDGVPTNFLGGGLREARVR